MNVEIVEKGLELARQNPELHDQRDYAHPTACGTAMCLAGWICVADGWDVNEHGEATKGKRRVFVGALADELANVNEDQSEELFISSSDDNIDQLTARWQNMKEEAGE